MTIQLDSTATSHALTLPSSLTASGGTVINFKGNNTIVCNGSGSAIMVNYGLIIEGGNNAVLTLGSAKPTTSRPGLGLNVRHDYNGVDENGSLEIRSGTINMHKSPIPTLPNPLLGKHSAKCCNRNTR